jgi:hypothetical protein
VTFGPEISNLQGRSGGLNHEVNLDFATPSAAYLPAFQLVGDTDDAVPAGEPTFTVWLVPTASATIEIPGVGKAAFTTGKRVFVNQNYPKNPDIVILGSGVGPRTILLRADRLPTGTGRVYTLAATAVNDAGLRSTISTTCLVPRFPGK